MKSRIDNLLLKLQIFSCFWFIGAGVFLFNTVFSEIAYFGLKLYVNIFVVLLSVIGIIGSLWFIKCPRCGEKIVLKSIKDESNFDYSKWKEDIKSCASCELKKLTAQMSDDEPGESRKNSHHE